MKAIDWVEKGNELAEAGKYEEAIECYDKTIEKNPDDAGAYNNKGIALDDLGKKEEAIECYNKAIEINPDYAGAYNNKGIALSDLGKKEEAIECYNKAIEINPDYAGAYNNKGFALRNLGKKEEAIECFDKAIEINHDYANAYNNKGNALSDLGKKEEAIECYNKAIEKDPDYAFAYNNKGFVLGTLDRYKEAVECYNKAIEKKPDYANAYNNKAYTLKQLGKYKEAIECCDKAIELSPDSIRYKHNKGAILVKLKDFEKATETFKKANTDILGIIVHLKDEPSKDVEEFVNYILDKDNFFNKIITEKENRDLYKKLYYESLYIVSLLHVNKDKEPLVAHYTSKSTSEIFMFPKENNNKLRLSSIANCNDPKEGQTLLDAILGKDCFTQLIQQETYRAFAGCFTFNEERLNQFRLYGKTDGQEATGVSLVFRQDFFSSDIKRSTPSNEEQNEQNEDKTFPLFRCIYIDPNTKYVASIGQREEYSFYRDIDENKSDKENEENKKIDKEKFDEYNKDIETTLKDVREKLKALETYIKKLDKDIVGRLLINLRYLTKHVAFKEEQECRVIRIERIDNEKVGVDDRDRLYIEYLPVRPYVVKICFAPKTPGMELYYDKLKHYKLNITCHRCDHPFAG